MEAAFLTHITHKEVFVEKYMKQPKELQLKKYLHIKQLYEGWNRQCQQFISLEKYLEGESSFEGHFFSTGKAANRKILTLDNMKRRNISIFNKCCMCKSDGESVCHLLHCSYAYILIANVTFASSIFHFGPIWSFILILVLFGLFQSYSVHISPIQIILVLFRPLWSNSVQYGLIRSDFGPLWYYSVQFGLFCSLHSNLVLFGPIQLYSIQFGHIRFYSVYSFYFSSIRSTFVLLGPIQFYLVNLVIFSQLCFYSVQFGHIRSNLVICNQLCFYSVQFSHFGPILSAEY